MFIKASSHTLDAKSRVFVPKRFQAGFTRDSDQSLVVYVTLGLEGCLFVFSEAGFQRAVAGLDLGTFTGKEQRKVQRLLFANTHELQLDSSGRLLIPEELRKRVGIEKEVVLVGLAERIEIWAKDRWDAFQAENADLYDELMDQLAGNSNGLNGGNGAAGAPAGG